MLDFLHDGEVAIKALLRVDRPEHYCEEMVGLWYDLREIHDRATKIIEIRRVRGTTMLITPERLYLVHLVLHARVDLSALFLRMVGSAESEDLMDTLTVGSFLQVRLYREMNESQRRAVEDSITDESARLRYQEMRNCLPLLEPVNQVINKNFISKLDRYVAALDHRSETLLRSFMTRPVPHLARTWFPLRRYASAPMRARQFIGLDVAGANLSSFRSMLDRLLGVLEERCGFSGPMEYV